MLDFNERDKRELKAQNQNKDRDEQFELTTRALDNLLKWVPLSTLQPIFSEITDFVMGLITEERVGGEARVSSAQLICGLAVKL